MLHLKFKSKVSSTDPTLNGESTGELWQNKSNYFFKTESAEIYADQKDVFMLIPSRKLIYRMDMAGQKEKQEAMDKMMLMQDSLLYFSSIGTIKKMSGNLLRIELLMTQKGKKKYQLEKVIYEIDTKQKKITSAEVYYLAEAIKINKISHVTYTFLAQDLVAEPIHFKGTLTKKFLKGTGLNDSYKNYKIVDNRKEKLKEVKNKVGY
ncbi:MAG: hypothetical protein NT150_00340 [Bacteroidetes bacterium]|nr:hypothetical protein [Bacteroidota bacterium]